MKFYFVGRVPVMAQLLEWAERHCKTPISMTEVESLSPYLDEGPVVVNHGHTSPRLSKNGTRTKDPIEKFDVSHYVRTSCAT